MQIAPAGDRARLLSLDQSISAADLHAAAAAVRRMSGILACIIGHSSLYVVFQDAPDERGLREALRDRPEREQRSAGTLHNIQVSFAAEGAPDLPELLQATGLSRDGFLSAVAELELVARYLGFRAGFAYLDGWPKSWSLPRRPTARPRVRAGSFAIAGNVAGFYPIDSPGGWNILGRTDAALWSEGRHPPNLFAAGDRIRIIPTLQALPALAAGVAASPLALPGAVIEAAPMATVVTAVDWSRADHGLPPGGAFDLEAAAAARQACGLPAEAPILECALVGPRLRLLEDRIGSWYGANVDLTLDGREVADPRQFAIRRGQTLSAGRIRNGLRGYLALGPQRGAVSTLHRTDAKLIRVLPGPHSTPLNSMECEVTPRIDRVGLRLAPLHPLPARAPSDLASCGMQCGTVQLHPDGSLVAMGPDHPVTGGYLQPMTVISADRWKLAQLAPGDRLRFLLQSP